MTSTSATDLTALPALPIQQPASESTARMVWRRFRRHSGARAGSIVLLILVLAVLLAPLSPYDPEKSSIRDRFQAPSWQVGS